MTLADTYIVLDTFFQWAEWLPVVLVIGKVYDMFDGVRFAGIVT